MTDSCIVIVSYLYHTVVRLSTHGSKLARILRARLQVKRSSRPRQRRERPPPLATAYPSHVWAYDFAEDRDMHGNALYILTVMDEFTREGLAIAGP